MSEGCVTSGNDSETSSVACVIPKGSDTSAKPAADLDETGDES